MRSSRRPPACGSESRGGFWKNQYTAPLGEVTRGRLVFVTGAPRMSLNFSPLPGANARLIMETSASRLEFTGAADGERPPPGLVRRPAARRARRRRECDRPLPSPARRGLLHPARQGRAQWDDPVDGRDQRRASPTSPARSPAWGWSVSTSTAAPTTSGWTCPARPGRRPCTSAAWSAARACSGRPACPSRCASPAACRACASTARAASSVRQAALRRGRLQRQPRPVRAGGAGRRGRGDRQLEPRPESSGPADPSRDAGPCRVSGRFARPVDVRRAASPWPRRTRRPTGRPRCAAGSAG